MAGAESVSVIIDMPDHSPERTPSPDPVDMGNTKHGDTSKPTSPVASAAPKDITTGTILPKDHRTQPTLTVDQLVSPLPASQHMAFNVSVAIQIDEEDDPLPPCTMRLEHDPLNISMPCLVSTPPPVMAGGPKDGEPSQTTSAPTTPAKTSDQSFPREQSSPSVFEIIFREDVSIQIEPDDTSILIELDLAELSEASKGKLTGSPPKPASPASSYAKMAGSGASKAASVSKLWACENCPRKYYTQKGLTGHSSSCKDKKDPPDTREQEREKKKQNAKAVPKKTKIREKKAPVVKPTYCKHCNMKIFLYNTRGPLHEEALPQALPARLALDG
ncbi:hypothetical protein TNCV_1429041 [Trichonephila clavipes]|nr:hypothetical protein TNCV_1429041 [Trichonephila clavipes]